MTNGRKYQMSGEQINQAGIVSDFFDQAPANLDSRIPQAQSESPGAHMSLTVEEMAKELNISKTTAYALVKQDGFPAFHVGKKILVNRRGLQRWMDNGGTANVKAC